MLTITPEECRITQAIEATWQGEYKSIADTARVFEIPYFKLYHRYNGHPDSSTLSGHNTKLNIEQDAAFKLYINRCIESGHPAKKSYVMAAANSIFQKARRNGIVSRAWYKRWKNKNKRLYTHKKTEALAAER